jgi:SAM-dependent methyltransferase
MKARLDRRTFRRVLGLAGSDAPSILDVGGGTGELSASLVAAGPPGTRGTVLDIDAQSAEVARGRGLEAVVSRFEDFETADRFDLILMLNLIEHVADPVATMVKARELLAPDGVVWIQTPDFHGLDARIFRHRNWAGYHCPRHWAIFGRRGLERALARAALEPISIKGTQAGAFWAASLLGLRRARRLPGNGRPLVQSPLFGPLAVLGAAFDLATAAVRPTSQLVTIARDNTEWNPTEGDQDGPIAGAPDARGGR